MTVVANDPIIICPECRKEIRLTESLAAPILAEAQKDFEKRLAINNANSNGASEKAENNP
jgi:hypothetical protein